MVCSGNTQALFRNPASRLRRKDYPRQARACPSKSPGLRYAGHWPPALFPTAFPTCRSVAVISENYRLQLRDSTGLTPDFLWNGQLLWYRIYRGMSRKISEKYQKNIEKYRKNLQKISLFNPLAVPFQHETIGAGPYIPSDISYPIYRIS